MCTATINKSSIKEGESIVLSWTSKHATSASLTEQSSQGTNSFSVALNGSRTFTPSVNTTYTLTFAGPGGTVECVDSIAVTKPVPKPVCTLTVDPSVIDRGEHTRVSWSSQHVTSVRITEIDADGSRVVRDTSATSGTFTVSPDIDSRYRGVFSGPNGTVTCEDNVIVKKKPVDPKPLRCDVFYASPSRVDEGEYTTLHWETTGATSVRIDNGIGSVALDGSTSVRVWNDTDFRLTATRGNDTVTCTTDVEVDEDDKPKSEPNPRCESFRASDTNITAGERVELRWRTDHGDELTIEDNRGNEIFHTRNSREVDRGEVTVRPNRDTRYTLTVERGRDDDECSVRVDVDDQEIVLITDRDQKPLTSISLTQVPYTGFDAGPFLTTVFYTLLGLWSAAVAYVLVVKRGSVFGFSLAGRVQTAHAPGAAAGIPQREYTHRAQAYAASASSTAHAPMNLPVGTYTPPVQATHTQSDEETGARADTHLEVRAHQHNVLLSSDAIRLIIDQADSDEEEVALLDAVIDRAKAAYPREDGWIVINRARIAELFADDAAPAAPEAADAPQVPAASAPAAGTLASAVVAGDTAASCAALGDEPLAALADAAADLDAVYRARRGEPVRAPEALVRDAAHLTDEQLEAAITALTDALGGTYQSEAAAAKLAVLKAAKAVAPATA